MNITADGIAASTSPIELTIKKRELQRLLEELDYSDSWQREDLQKELDRLVQDVRMCLSRDVN